MPPDLVALLVLVGVFLVATLRPVNMGAVALVAALLPAIAVWNSETDALEIVREFGYEDFKGRLS